MKICQLCAVDFTLYHFLLPLMEAERAEGHEVVGACADGGLVGAVRRRGFRVATLPLTRGMSPRRNLRATRALVAFFRRERFDMVHVHTPVAAAVGRLAAAVAGVPRIVYTAHGFYFHDRMEWPKRLAFIAVEWFGGRMTHTLFTQSAEDAGLARRYRLCRAGDVLAIGNGSDPARFRPDENGCARARLRAALETPEERIVVMTVGRLVAEKGYRELIAAIAQVDAELWAVGERLQSDHAAGIGDIVRRCETDPALRDRIRFLGYRDDVPDLLRAADLFVLPSWREGMPRSIIEAMLTGLPVVATNIRGSREEVVDGETGFLVPVGNEGALARALRRLVADGGLRRRMGGAGLERARRLYVEDAVLARQIDHLGLRRP